MAKTTIQCSFTDASGTPLTGYILVGVDSWLMKSDNTTSITNRVSDPITFTAGACTLQLEPSETEGVTYWFEVYYKKSVTTTDPATGLPIVTITDTVLLPRFYAMVPVSTTAITFNQLAKQSGINRDNIDTALSAITRRLYVDDNFWSRIQGTMFTPRGEYSPTAWYSRGDVVFYDGGSFLYYNDTRTTGNTPNPTVTTAYWQPWASRGVTGAGTTGNNAVFSSAWVGQTDAPSRNAVYNAFQLYALASTVSGFAPLNSPVFTGSPTIATALPTGDNTTKVATTAWVQTLIANLVKAMIPVGFMAWFAGGSAPTGWVLCDGRTLSKTTYSDLFAVLGTTWNTGGELSTEFRVPDVRARVLVAPDAMGGVAANRNVGIVPGNSGGSARVTLDATQIPSHSHLISLMTFTASSLSTISSAYGSISFGGSTPNYPGVAGNRLTNADGAGAIANTGGGLSHENMPPYLTMNCIIYTAV